MTEHTVPLQAPPRPSLGAVLAGMALPFLLFAVVLAGMLLLSVQYVLPTFSRVEVGGAARTAEEVGAYQARLQATLIDLQQQRSQTALPLLDPSYEALKDARLSLPSFESLREEVLQTALALTPEQDAVHVDSLTLQTTDRTLQLTGDVRHVGLRSMTVLANFVDELHRLPGVASVEQPTFQREDDGPDGPHSPFTFSLQLR